MAFKTRTDRTVAVGTGAMSTAITMTALSLLLLIAPLAVAAGFGAWFLLPDQRRVIEDLLPSALAMAIACLGLQVMTRLLVATCALSGFIGPANRFRDQLSALANSMTARRAVFSACITVGLLIVMRFPFGSSRRFVIIALTIALVVTEVATLHGLVRIASASRRDAYFENMTPAETRIADRPWPVLSRPSFPDPSTVSTSAGADRYRRRASDIAELHTWIGAGIIVVFSAFVGASISALWEKPQAATPLPSMAVLACIGLGFWIQRRSRTYRSLAQEFLRRQRSLELHEARQPELRRWYWRLLGVHPRNSSGSHRAGKFWKATGRRKRSIAAVPTDVV